MARIEHLRGDITTLEVDAIVNAANDRLAPGGGVCGAIHAAAGPRLAEACAALGGCPTGSAAITPGFDLAAAWVIHAVGPVWRGGDAGEDEALRGAYLSSMALARAHGLNSVAFPAISTGIYGFPLERACALAVAAVAEGLEAEGAPERVVLVAFDARTDGIYADLLAQRRPLGEGAPWRG